MSLLAKFLHFLEWVETTQAIFEFLTQPTGLATTVALCLYAPLQILGCDALSAATLASALGLCLYHLGQQPEL
ncbi:MAG: hypothetical protein AAF152_13720 [Cyanobacteria bacterium P01_A01_bin.114]